MFFEFIDALYGLVLFDFTLAAVRGRYYAYREHTRFFGQPRNDGCRTRARTTAHARRNEHHFDGRLHDFFDKILALLGGFLADARVHTTPEALQKSRAQLNFVLDGTKHECLTVGVAHHKFNIFDALAEHVVYGIAASSSHTYYSDDGNGCRLFAFFHYEFVIVIEYISFCI